MVPSRPACMASSENLQHADVLSRRTPSVDGEQQGQAGDLDVGAGPVHGASVCKLTNEVLRGRWKGWSVDAGSLRWL